MLIKSVFKAVFIFSNVLQMTTITLNHVKKIFILQLRLDLMKRVSVEKKVYCVSPSERKESGLSCLKAN